MFPTDQIGKVTDKKTIVMKCKLNTGTGVNVMLLPKYLYLNPSKFDEKVSSFVGMTMKGPY